MTIDKALEAVEKAVKRVIKGGPGSGNFGHAGRPGEVGGSASVESTSGGGESSGKGEATCPICKGTGKARIEQHIDPDTGKPDVELIHPSRTQTCPTCEGSGKLEASYADALRQHYGIATGGGGGEHKFSPQRNDFSAKGPGGHYTAATLFEPPDAQVIDDMTRRSGSSDDRQVHAVFRHDTVSREVDSMRQTGRDRYAPGKQTETTSGPRYVSQHNTRAEAERAATTLSRGKRATPTPTELARIRARRRELRGE
jgi:hypothetical protein